MNPAAVRVKAMVKKATMKMKKLRAELARTWLTSLAPMIQMNDDEEEDSGDDNDEKD